MWEKIVTNKLETCFVKLDGFLHNKNKKEKDKSKA
jgi:hypothetical protein